MLPPRFPPRPSRGTDQAAAGRDWRDDDEGDATDTPQTRRLTEWILQIAKSLPRGSFPIVSFLASRDPSLRSYEIPLKLMPGRTVRADLRYSVWHPLWRHGCYPHQLPEDEISNRILRPGDTVWDVGASVGYTALLFAHAVAPGGHVVAIEPSRTAVQFLKRSVRGCDAVAVVNAAVSSSTGEVGFVESRRLDLSHVAGRGDSHYTVESITLDALAARGVPAPTLLKVDVEGHELAVFEGGRQLIARHRPLIYFEAHGKPEREAVIECIRSIDLDQYRFVRAHVSGDVVPEQEWESDGTTNNYFAIPRKHAERFNW